MGKKNKKQPAMRLLEDWSEKVQENEAVFHEKVKATVKRQLTRKQQRKSAAAAWGAASSGAASPERGAASPPAAGTGRGLRLQLPLDDPAYLVRDIGALEAKAAALDVYLWLAHRLGLGGASFPDVEAALAMRERGLGDDEDDGPGHDGDYLGPKQRERRKKMEVSKHKGNFSEFRNKNTAPRAKPRDGDEA